jgi:hypothetical protein
MSLSEVQLYNLHQPSSSSAADVKYFQRVNAIHYRLDHKMTLGQIAKRLGLKMKEVKVLLGE